MAQTKTPAKVQEKAIIKSKGEQITVSFHDVKTLICPLATDQEVAIFLKTCQALQISPFHNEIYLIKYSDDDKAAMVIAIDSYLKAAEVNDSYNGYEAGIILRDSGGKLEFREGAILLDDEKGKLAGGWARVYRKDRDRPTYIAVNKKECIRLTRYGKPTRFWTEEKQPSMLRKVALKRALVEAFPSLFAGTMATAEVGDDAVDAEYEERHEGEIPPAFQKNGKIDWRKFYARIRSELGLTPEQAHELVDVDHFNDLLSAGWTMEQIWDSLVSSLQQRKAPAQGVEHGEEILYKALPGMTMDELRRVRGKVDNHVRTRIDQEIASRATITEQVVNPETGEIMPPDEEDAGAAAPTEVQQEESADAAAPSKPKRDPNSLKTINDLLKACNQDFKLQPKDVYKELGYKSASDISEKPSDCYQKIAAKRA